ncbi:DUF5995 family protein [Larkinella soli]|uniref:DUF5995 family protein n=1 Tax=Larkinella soli TaxID=1770527 RepID=UPI000FFB6B00|nr:DUF5995 family protein [Larkinella soli]
MNTPSPSVWTDEFLWSKRLVGDPEADQVFRTLVDRNQKGEVDQIFQMLVRNRDFPNPAFDALPTDVRDLIEGYFVATRKLPDWAEPFKLMVAADLFRQYGPKILLVLLCKSLPLCYTCWRGAKVLYRTGRLRVHDGSLNSFTRRLMETAQFVVDILTPDSFEHDGHAIVAIQKVRLVHAAIRYFAQERDWDTEVYGLPINQEDLSGTLLSFSVVIVDGLEQLGIELTPEEREAFFHLWHVVGYLIGVDDDLNPEAEDDCRFLMNAILEQQAGPSAEGAELTDACIDLMNSRLSFGPFKDISHVFVRFFIGDRYADMLSVPKEDDAGDSRLLNAVQWLDKRFRGLSERNVLVAALGRSFSSGMIEMVLDYHNGSKNEQFVMPSALTRTWQETKPDFRVPPLTGIGDAIFYFEKLTRHFKAQNNPMGLFTAVYKIVTERVAEGIRQGLFENNEKMEQVDTRFCTLYFEAVNRYFDDEPAPAPWQVSFDAARRPLIANQHIFSACNAHIGYDLPQVVSELFPGDEVQRFYNDFMKMNELFDAMYDQMNDNIGRIFRPFGTMLRYFDERILRAERAIMREGREKAWQNSISLAQAADETDRRKRIAALEQESARLGRKLVDPPLLLRLPLELVARNEVGTVAQKIDVMLRSALLPTVQ